MFHARENGGVYPLTTSSSSGSASSGSSTTTIQILNMLTPKGDIAGQEFTQIHHYNDLLKPKNVNTISIKDVNLKRNDSARRLSDFGQEIWNPLNAHPSSNIRHVGRRKLQHQDNIKENSFFNETSFDRREKNVNLALSNSNEEHFSMRNIKENSIQDISEKQHNNAEKQSDVPKQGASYRGIQTQKYRNWWRGRMSLRTSTLKKQSTSNNVLTGNFKRNRLWSSLSKTFDIPDRLTKDDKKVKKVPKLQIWLSTDNRERCSSPPSPALNNARDTVSRIQLDQPMNINRSLLDNGRWRALSEGSAPTTSSHDHNIRSVNENTGTLKSPVEKQPTWPLGHMLQPRPKLIHQNCLTNQSEFSQESSFGGKRLELPRQNAISDDAEGKENDMLKPVGSHVDLNRWSFSTESQNSTNLLPSTDSRSSFNHMLSAGARNTLGLNLIYGRRDAAASRSYSDERSESYEVETGPRLNHASNSVFSLNDTQSTPSPTWTSSHASIPVEGQRSPTYYQQDFLSPSQRAHHSYRSRTSSVNSNSCYNYVEPGQYRLTIPGSNCSSRRPSLLSMRSLNRSQSPYPSMDYDYEYEMLYNIHNELVQEAVPRLSFTQKLAFPTLHQNSIDRPKPRDPYTEAENSMNTIAKIITILVLAFVSVFVLGGLFKLFN